MAKKTLAERADALPQGITPLLTMAQLQAYYGVSDWTVRQWMKAGCPTAPIAVRGVRFDLNAVRAWMADGTAHAAA